MASGKYSVLVLRANLTMQPHRLRQSWTTALNNAESLFKSLLASTDWRRVPTPTDTSSPTHKGKARAFSSSLPELSDVILHRKPGTDVYRVILEGEEFPSLEPCKVVLATPELRQVWDPAVEEARLVEMFDCETRICKTKFTLGWPAKYVSPTAHSSSYR
jgi:hypothetical protein